MGRNNHENRDYYNSRTEMNVDRNYVPEMDPYRPPEEERRHFDRNSRPEMGYDRPAEEERGGHRNWRRHEERQFHQDETLYREYSNEFEQQNRHQDSHRFHEGNNRNFDQQYQRNYENTNAEVCVGYDDGNPRPEIDFDRNHRSGMQFDRPRGEKSRQSRRRQNESYHPRQETGFNGGRPEGEMMVLDEFKEGQVEDDRPVTVTNDKP